MSISGEAASYTAFAFYKVIHCGDDAGLRNLQTYTGANSLKDSNDGIYVSSLSKLRIELDIYLSQEVGEE